MSFFIKSGNNILAGVNAPATVNYFYITPHTSDGAVVSICRQGNPNEITLEYKVNNGQWSNYTFNTNVSLNYNDKLYFRGDNDYFSTDASNYYYVTTVYEVEGSYVSNTIDVGGDLTTLLSKQGNVLDLTPYGTRIFNQIFRNQGTFDPIGNANVIDASQLVLPSTTLADYCYSNMFASQGSNGTNGTLEHPPALPATTLANYCYNYMFPGNANMNELPTFGNVTNVENYSCKHMFAYCTSLSKLPRFISNCTYFGQGAFNTMFRNCYNIKLSDVQSGEYTNKFIFGIAPDSTTASNMFVSTGGTFTGTPTQQTYYTSNTIV